MAQKAEKRGKYEKVQPKKLRSKKTMKAVLTCCVILLVGLLTLCWVLERGQTEKSVFEQITDDGYVGTQEQWLASIAGEEADVNDAKSSYQMACDNGYTKTEASWILTLSRCDSYESGDSPYEAACRNGYSGSLAQWMEAIADAPEKLGVSENGESKTEYEMACEYGYAGTFIEWLISVTSDRVL